MTKRETLAYLAGLCDGESYIGIKKTKDYKHLTGRVNPGYHERIQIRMVDESAIRFLAETLGGWYYKEKPSVAKGRPLYCYQANDISAVKIIQSLLPYLRVKKPNAERVIALRIIKQNPEFKVLSREMIGRWGKPITVNRRQYAPAMIEACEKLWLECKHLNRVGVGS